MKRKRQNPRKRSPKKAIKTKTKPLKKATPLKSIRKLSGLAHKGLSGKKIRKSPSSAVRSSDSFQLPVHYGENKVVLLVRDPWWIYAYWEVMPEREREVRDRIARQGLQAEKTVLRVYDVTQGSGLPPDFFDIELNVFADNWYIEVAKPDRRWQVEIGIRTREGRFFPMVRSNVVRTPRHGVSDILDEEWMLPEEISRRIFGRLFEHELSSENLIHVYS